MKTADVIPAEHFILREYVPVMDHFFMLHSHFFINIIGNDHIHNRFCPNKFLDFVQDLHERLFIHPVVAVHHFKIHAGRLRKPCVDRISMTAVFLIDHPDDPRVHRFIPFPDLRRLVFGTVIDDKNLHILSRRQDRIDRMLHIFF